MPTLAAPIGHATQQRELVDLCTKTNSFKKKLKGESEASQKVMTVEESKSASRSED